MSRQKAGLKYEHDLAAKVYETTDGSVIPLRAGWSGNSSVAAPDLLIPYKGSLRAIEVKTSGQKRLIVEPEDVEDVMHWAMHMNEVHTFAYLTIKFTYYEAQTFRLDMPWDIQGSFEILHETTPFDTNLTRGGNISFGHPTHYSCGVVGASKSPGDGAALLRDLRDDQYANVDSAEMDTVGVYEVLQEHPDYYKRFNQ